MQDCVLELAQPLVGAKDEATLLPFGVDKAAQASLSFVGDGASNAMNTFNGNALDPA